MLQLSTDPWLAGILARPAHRVAGSIVTGEEAMARAALAPLAATGGFAYARVPTADVRLAQLLEDAGFRLVDAGITLEARSIDDTAIDDTGAAGSGIRMARADDAARIEAIARAAFRFSRFHLDPHIPRAVADEIKAQWAANFFHGRRGDHMVVADRGGAVAGFLQLLAGPDGTLTIDLIGVAEAHRGHGLASGMIAFAARECGRPERIRVGTQAANVGSLRLYERLGFTVAATSYVLHYHAPASR
jgi:ribosomal protein S18 acetylase RimI-like enzyme